MSETINFLVKQGEIIGEASGGGGGNTDTIEAQIGYVEATDTATSAHAVGSYFINKTGQFVKTTSAIAVGDTIAVGTNCQATDIAGVLAELNSNYSTYVSMQIGQLLPSGAIDAPWNYGIRPRRLFSFVHDSGGGLFLGFFDSGNEYGAELQLNYNLNEVAFRSLYARSWGNWKTLTSN